jgi:hypothetical protein
MQRFIRESFHGDQRHVLEFTRSSPTTKLRRAINEHLASAALLQTTTQFYAFEPERITQDMQQWHVGVDLEVVGFTIDVEPHQNNPS